jgi:lipoyl-dependent peroxiredoxin
VFGVDGTVRGGGYEGDGRDGTIAAATVRPICTIDRVDQLYRINRFDQCHALVTMKPPQQENVMSVDVKYRTSATATGGRDGQAATADGSLNIKLTTPKELGGVGGPGNNPEQLFAAGYAACFIGAMKAVAPAQKLRVPNDATVTATVGIGPRSEGGFGITADLKVSLPGLDRADAKRLVDAAHQVCPYSNATRGNVDVGLTLG